VDGLLVLEENEMILSEGCNYTFTSGPSL